MARIKLGLRNLSISETILKGNVILRCMQGNTHLPPDPTPSLQQIETCLNELKATAIKALNGGKLQITIRDEKKEEFLILLRRLGGWIASQTTNYVAIQSTGFDVVKKSGGEIQMQKPEYVRRVFNAKTNILKILWTPVPGAKQYLVEVSENGFSENAQWSVAGYTSQAKYSPKQGELKPLTRYFYRVRALGTSGISPVSSVVSAAVF